MLVMHVVLDAQDILMMRACQCIVVHAAFGRELTDPKDVSSHVLQPVI